MADHKAPIVEISLEDFQLMVERMDDQKKRIEELERINDFLNDQIHDYNQKFSKKNKEAIK